MAFIVIKFVISAGVIAIASEIAKRSTTFSALLISLPLISILSYVWVFLETKDAARVADLSTSTLLLVIPSLAFFVILSVSIKYEFSFWLSLAFSVGGTFLSYLVYWKALGALGVRM